MELIGETQAIEINEKGGGQSSTVWVSVEAPHRVVKIVRRDKGVAETISLEEFGVAVNAEAPAADDVVDLSSYEKKAPAKQKGRAGLGPRHQVVSGDARRPWAGRR